MMESGRVEEARRRARITVAAAHPEHVTALAVQALLLLELRDQTIPNRAYRDEVLDSLAPTFALQLRRLLAHANTVREITTPI